MAVKLAWSSEGFPVLPTLRAKHRFAISGSAGFRGYNQHAGEIVSAWITACVRAGEWRLVSDRELSRAFRGDETFGFKASWLREAVGQMIDQGELVLDIAGRQLYYGLSKELVEKALRGPHLEVQDRPN